MTSRDAFVHRFGAPGDASARRLGGKGAGIERLVRCGARVPRGFCLTTAAFERHVEAHALDVGAPAPGELARALTTLPLPDDVARALAAAVDDVSSGIGAPQWLAVRSSASGEDARDAAFAGQHDTVLGVAAEDVEGAVRRCWASLFTERAVAYRAARDATSGAMAVVVQELVPADASAVVFTTNPLAHGDGEMVVEATRGLGEPITSGEIVPDSYTVDRATLAVTSAVPGDIPFVVTLAPHGTARVSSENDGDLLVLDDGSIADLARACLAVERAFGMPVDVEAARARGRWYLLQARAITARV